jgi:hypothetical protein
MNFASTKAAPSFRRRDDLVAAAQDGLRYATAAAAVQVTGPHLSVVVMSYAFAVCRAAMACVSHDSFFCRC